MLLLKTIVSYRKNKREENDESCRETSFLWFLLFNRNDKRIWNLCQKHLYCPVCSALLCTLGAVFLQPHVKWRPKDTTIRINKNPTLYPLLYDARQREIYQKSYLEIILYTAFTRSFATGSKLEQLWSTGYKWIQHCLIRMIASHTSCYLSCPGLPS